MFIDVVNIGYSSDALIPENNVINLNKNIINNNRELSDRRRIFCFTTRGHENPVWMVSNDDFSFGPLMNTGNVTMALRGGNITTVTIRYSFYEFEIYIDADSVDFTANLTCRSQNNSEAQHTVVVTTSKSVLLILYALYTI